MYHVHVLKKYIIRLLPTNTGIIKLTNLKTDNGGSVSHLKKKKKTNTKRIGTLKFVL